MYRTNIKLTHALLLLLLLLPLHQTADNFSAALPTRTRPRGNRSNQLLARLGEEPQRFDFAKLRNGNMFYTNLDSLRDLVVAVRSASLRLALSKYGELSARNYAQGKMQAIVPNNVQFPCALNNQRSPYPPTSVHRLKPGDIDVIATFGDSISAGNGIMTDVALDMINEFRGMSFSGGGLGTWRQFLTLPNILKLYNPNLYGYAVANALVVNSDSSRLNVAEPMIMSHDLPYMAHVLVERMRQDRHVDMKNHWKLLTIYVGNNDICSDMCHWDSEAAFLARHEQDMRRAFTILRDNVPRLLINLLPVPNMFNTVAVMTHESTACDVVHRVGCNCVFGQHGPEMRERLKLRNFRFQQVDEYVAALPEFQTETFSVIFYPNLMGNTTMPTLPNGNTDYRYFGHDCFHFSQLGHASIANMLWNAMFTPRKLQQRVLQPPLQRLVCPSEANPYIMTPRNDAEFNQKWRS